MYTIAQYVFYDKSKNPGVFYEYSTKGSGGTSNSNHTPTYNWDFIEWSDCDVKCGGGTEVAGGGGGTLNNI